jgi:hypothetical protein
VALAGLSCGCAGRGASLAQLDGSEPQRLSFGDPMSVQSHFAEKVRACWFGGATPVLQGYRFDDASLINVANSPSQEAAAPHIRILSGEGQNPAFEVEFHAYNDNTLISTRNHSLPQELAARLKKDVETWIFGDKGCGVTKNTLVTAQARPAAPAQQASAHFQEAYWTGAPSAQLASATASLPPR